MISRLLAWNYVNTLSRNVGFAAFIFKRINLDYCLLHMMMLEMMIQMIEHFSMHVNTFEKNTSSKQQTKIA